MARHVAIIDSLGLPGSTDPVVTLAALLKEKGYDVAVYSPVSDEMASYLAGRGIGTQRPRIWAKGPIRSTPGRRVLTPAIWMELAARAAARASIVIAFDAQGFVPSSIVKYLRPDVLLVVYLQDIYIPDGYVKSFYLQYLKAHGKLADLSVQHNAFHVAIRREVFGLKCPAHTMIESPLEAIPRPPDWREDGGPLRLVYQGTIASYTGMPQLIAAMKECGDEATLTVMGHMPIARPEQELYRAEFARARNIEFLGWLDTDKMLERTRRADVGIVLRPHRTPDVSLTCLFPGSQKVYQYLACGLPVLASDNPTFGFVEQEGVGFCVAAETSTAIASAIRRLGDPVGRALMGRRARALFKERYNRRAQTRGLLDALLKRCPP